MKALVVFSGGQDSTTCLGWAKNRFEKVEAISFNYGQRHSIEIEKAKKIASKLNIKHKIVDISFFGQIVNSALTGPGEVNLKHSDNENLPASFVPNRNAMFLTIAHAYAQKIGAEKLITGVCETDYSGYPDCRQSFITSINESLNLGSDSKIEILTPLMYLDKAKAWQMAENENIFEIVKTMTLSCYNAVETMHQWGYGCEKCNACILRKKGYEKYINQGKTNV